MNYSLLMRLVSGVRVVAVYVKRDAKGIYKALKTSKSWYSR